MGDIDGNLERAADAVAAAVAEGTNLVVFPELSVSGCSIGEVDTDHTLICEEPLFYAGRRPPPAESRPGGR